MDVSIWSSELSCGAPLLSEGMTELQTFGDSAKPLISNNFLDDLVNKKRLRRGSKEEGREVRTEMHNTTFEFVNITLRCINVHYIN